MRSPAGSAYLARWARSGRARRRSARLVAVFAAAGLAIGGLGVGAVQAEPPTDDPTTAAELGARWLAAQYEPAGFVPTGTGDPNVGATLQDTLALAAAAVEQPAFDQAMTWLQANAATVVDGGATGDDPARIAYLLLLADAAGIDPATFGGLDLPARLLATEGAFEPGLFGGADPTYDGAFRQSLAISGLLASATPVPASARGWLVDQQCDATNPLAEGGWQAYRGDIGMPCDDPDPLTYTGPDTNSTAMAIQALFGAGPFAGSAAALDFLAGAQADDGGFPYVGGGTTDPNSTALVILAIVAAGEDPTTGRWALTTPDPLSSLLGWQVGCDAPAEDQGAFASPFSSGYPDEVATSQAVWGAAGRVFPLGATTFAAAATPCAVDSTTSTSTTTTTVIDADPVTTAGPPTPTPASMAAAPVTAQPQLTG